MSCEDTVTETGAQSCQPPLNGRIFSCQIYFYFPVMLNLSWLIRIWCQRRLNFVCSWSGVQQTTNLQQTMLLLGMQPVGCVADNKMTVNHVILWYAAGQMCSRQQNDRKSCYFVVCSLSDVQQTTKRQQIMLFCGMQPVRCAADNKMTANHVILWYADVQQTAK